MPTSGTGSLWRLITTISAGVYFPVKISEEYERKGIGAELPSWRPEPLGHVYMYNTPHYVNPSLADPAIRLITNFRDPRDLACNQFHWAQQHPMPNRSTEYIETYRRNVAQAGIDAFVARQDNNILFRSLTDLAPRLSRQDPDVLKLSYAQLCLDFDGLVERLFAFFGVARDAVPVATIERERTVNLKNNPNWIGQVWSGGDIMPGRYRRELTRETIAVIDEKYKANLKRARTLERPHLRALLATEAEREDMDRVLVGKDDELFLRNDANNSVAQITGQTRLSRSELTRIAMAHHSRHVFGSTIANFRYGHAVIPSKEVVHRHLLPSSTPFEQHGARPVGQYIGAGMTRLWQFFYEPALLEPQDAQRFYPHTDSHWNHAGAVRYFGAFLSNFAPELAMQLKNTELRHFTGRQQGDLGMKLEMETETIEISSPICSHGRLVFENGINNEGCVRWYCNDQAPGGQRAFILHDSFTLWLLGLLPELFKEVVFFHGTVFDYDFVVNFAPDIVLSIQAERFFVRSVETGGDMMRFVSLQEKEKNAPRSFAEFLQERPLQGRNP